MGYYKVWKLSIFWFYVKSILADFRRSKNAFITTLNTLNFDFWKPSHLKNVNSFQKFKIQSCSIGQNSSFWGFKMAKVDFTYNLSSRKILNSTLCIPNKAAHVCTSHSPQIFAQTQFLSFQEITFHFSSKLCEIQFILLNSFRQFT